MTGFPTAFGVFQEYYSSHPESLKDSTANVAVIGTTITVGALLLSCHLEQSHQELVQRNLVDKVCLCRACIGSLI
jgi:hypothetical protein